MVKSNQMPSVSALREEYNIARRLFLMTKNSDDLLPKQDNIRCKNVDRLKMDFLPREVANITKQELEPFVNGRRIGNYLLGKTIGEGSFAKVKEALHICTGEKVAIKVIDKRRAQEDRYVSRNLRREARILQLVHHPNVIQLLEVMETEKYYYIVTELCLGGDFLDFICDRKYLDEDLTKKYVRQLVSAMWSLHSLGIVHRDLKIENFLLDESGNLKIVDFGLSNLMPSGAVETYKRTGVHPQLLTTHCGSPAYAAPELLAQKKYGPQVDVWSVGVNMYAMLTGTLPYLMEPFSIMDVYEKMMARQMNPVPENLSEDCKDLLRRFLDPLPERRISLENAARHPWLASREWHTNLHNSLYSSALPSIDNLDENILLHIRDKIGLRMRDVIMALSEGRAVNASVIYRLLHARLKRYRDGDKKFDSKFEPVKFRKIEVIKKAKVLLGNAPKNERPKFVYKGMKIGCKKSKSQPLIVDDSDSDPIETELTYNTRPKSSDSQNQLLPYLSERRMSNPDNYVSNGFSDDAMESQENILIDIDAYEERQRANTLKSQSESIPNGMETDCLPQGIVTVSAKDGPNAEWNGERKKKGLCRSYSDGAENRPLVKTMKVLAKKPLQHSQAMSVQPRSVKKATPSSIPYRSSTYDNDPSGDRVNGIASSNAVREELKDLVGALQGLAEDTKKSTDLDCEVSVRRTPRLNVGTTETVVPSPVRAVKLHHGICMDEVKEKAAQVLKKRQENSEMKRRKSLEETPSKEHAGRARWEKDRTPVKRKRIIRAIDSENFECVVRKDSRKEENDVSTIDSLTPVQRIRESKSFHDFTVTDLNDDNNNNKINAMKNAQLTDFDRDKDSSNVETITHPSEKLERTTNKGIGSAAPFALKMEIRRGSKEEPVPQNSIRESLDKNRCQSATPSSKSDSLSTKANNSLFKIDVVRVAKCRSIPVYAGELVNTQPVVQSAQNGVEAKGNIFKHKGRHFRRCKGGSSNHMSQKNAYENKNDCITKTEQESKDVDNIDMRDDEKRIDNLINDVSEENIDDKLSLDNGYQVQEQAGVESKTSNSERVTTSHDKTVRSKDLSINTTISDKVKETYNCNVKHCEQKNKSLMNGKDEKSQLKSKVVSSGKDNDTISKIAQSSSDPPNKRTLRSKQANSLAKGKLAKVDAAENEVRRKLAEMKERRLLGKRKQRANSNKEESSESKTSSNVSNMGSGVEKRKVPSSTDAMNGAVCVSDSTCEAVKASQDMVNTGKRKGNDETNPVQDKAGRKDEGRKLSGSRVTVSVEDEPVKTVLRSESNEKGKQRLEEKTNDEMKGKCPQPTTDGNGMTKTLVAQGKAKEILVDEGKEVTKEKCFGIERDSARHDVEGHVKPCSDDACEDSNGVSDQNRPDFNCASVSRHSGSTEQVSDQHNTSNGKCCQEQSGKNERNSKGNVADRFLSKLGDKSSKVKSRGTQNMNSGRKNADGRLKRSRVKESTLDKSAGNADDTERSFPQGKADRVNYHSKGSEKENVEENTNGKDQIEDDVFSHNIDEDKNTDNNKGESSTQVARQQWREERRKSREDAEKKELERQVARLQSFQHNGEITIRERSLSEGTRNRRVIVVDDPTNFDGFTKDLAKMKANRGRKASQLSRKALESIDES